MRILLSAIVALPILAVAQTGKAKKKQASAQSPGEKQQGLNTAIDSFSYALGLNIAINLKQQGIGSLKYPVVLAAFADVYAGRTLAIDTMAANNIVAQKFAAIAQENANAEKLKGLNFLSANKKRPGIISTGSGLQYEILKAGTGEVPADSSTVTLHYTAITLDGYRFDSSASRRLPMTLRISEAIAGWAEALKLMPVGSKWRVYIPFYLAYGDAGRGPSIPPGGTLIFELELLSVTAPLK